ncbi:MAG: capsid assembly protein [Ferrovibrio sp.]|uniref:capsid assembly protein n=1 Tax=Ferrovibrio sp. TaxID=1917215 RepID=UPI00391D28FB
MTTLLEGETHDGGIGEDGAGVDAIPEKFRDPRTGELRVDLLLKSYRALEQKLAGMVSVPGADADDDSRRRFFQALGVPESPDGYEISFKDPALWVDPEVNKRLHEAGFTPAQAQLVYDLACDHVAPHLHRMAGEFRYRGEREKLVQRYGSEARFAEMARTLEAWGKRNLPESVFTALASSYEGIVALETMMQGGDPKLVSGERGGEMLNEEQLVGLMRDPRYWKKRDPEILAKVTEGFRRLYPG